MEPLSRITSATVDVLAALQSAGEPTWGLAVVKTSGRPAGSVYPILERLERAGWVRSAWEDAPDRSGPRRRLYELTDEGAPAARATIAAHTARSTSPTRALGTAPLGTAPIGAASLGAASLGIAPGAVAL